MPGMHVLLLEDDLDLGKALTASLRTQGWAVTWWRCLRDAPTDLDEAGADCVVLDLGLPDGDGMARLQSWRKRGGRTPVIVITARGTLAQRLCGLDSGADDYLVKPFAVAELLSRVRAVNRRHAGQASDTWQVGQLTFNPASRQVSVAGQVLELSPREHHLLAELLKRPGAVVPKDRLAQRLEPLGEAVTFSALEVHLSNLRKKVGAQRIRTLRGLGYQWVVDPAEGA